ncbi:MAG TPA: hypothetical protein VGG88_04610 [Gaiellaceae bacterium]
MSTREGTKPATANLAPMHRKLDDPQRDVDAEIGHIRGLVLIRKLLAERGASSVELHQCDAVIARCREELAELALRAAA